MTITDEQQLLRIAAEMGILSPSDVSLETVRKHYHTFRPDGLDYDTWNDLSFGWEQVYVATFLDHLADCGWTIAKKGA